MKWHKTKFPGVRYREHKTRKHGIQKDKYFAIYYQQAGKRKEEGLGWATKGWSAQDAAIELTALKKAHITGEGPQTLAEKRKIKEEQLETEQREADRHEKESITFKDYYETVYLPSAIATKKPKSVSAEKGYFKNWIKPVIGNKPFKDIHPINIERIKQNMLKGNRAPRSIQYCLAITRQIWNQAYRDGLIDKESPTKQVSIPKIDNKRLRFFTHDEADILLQDLKSRSQQLHDIALLSLHTGMRASEIFTLKWSAVDIDQELIYIIEAKGGSRTNPMTQSVKQMLTRLREEKSKGHIFLNRKGSEIKDISNSFNRSIGHLELNKNIEDNRQKALFHTLRHTYASWLVQQGEPLYTVQKLMGHASIAMTERYSHLAPDTFKKSMNTFEKKIQEYEHQKDRELKKQDQVINLKDLSS